MAFLIRETDDPQAWTCMRKVVHLPDGTERMLVITYDLADRDLVEDFTWYIRPDFRTFYAATSTWQFGWGAKGFTYMHRLLLGDREGRIAHLNGNGLDNRRSNLRPASQAEILAKRRPPSGGTSAYKGVCWDSHHGKWVARFRGKSLGRFRDEAQAARAFDAAARAHWGDLAYCNFPA